MNAQSPYRARLDVDYPVTLDRFTSLVRAIWAIPIVIVLTLLTATGSETVVTEAGEPSRSPATAAGSSADCSPRPGS